MKTYSKSFSHIGIIVPNITKVVQFYSALIGWYIIMQPSKVKREKDTVIRQMCIDVFGGDWETFKIAHMSTSDGIGIELFLFPHGLKEVSEFSIIKFVGFHIKY